MQFFGFVWQCSSDRFSALCHFGDIAWRAHKSHASRSPASEALFALRPVRLHLIRSLRQHPVESSWGALRHRGFGFSASMAGLHPRRLPSRLTSRSSRRRVVASLKLPGMRAILAPIRRVRRGLTPALGGRKAFCNCVARKPDSLASVTAALWPGCRHVASSVKSVWRAHTLHTSRYSASETVFGVGKRAATHAVISDRSS